MQSPDLHSDGTTRIRLDISYDGSAFTGWARQPGFRTVQGVLEDALTLLARSEDRVRLTVAGRTDVGVHASGQVAHADVPNGVLHRLVTSRQARAGEDAAQTLRRRINGILGHYADVQVQRAEFAAEGFDARFSALWRRYEYRLADVRSTRDPLVRAFTSWTSASLDVDAMNEASAALVGLHDWASFCKPRLGATTIRELLEFDWRRDDRGVLVAHVRADAFCHSMVRALVGACVAAGERRFDALALIGLRDEARRTNEFKVMPARGLSLIEVGYPDDEALAARAAETRAVRERTERLESDGSGS